MIMIQTFSNFAARPRFAKAAVLMATLAAALAVAAPASAQRMTLSERVTRLEQRAGDNQATLDLLRQVNLLKDEVQSLRAQLEQLTHEHQQLKQTTRAQYLDLDGRINRMQGGASGPDVPVLVPPGATPADGAAAASDSGAAATAATASAAGVAGDAAAAASGALAVAGPTAVPPADAAPAVYGDPGAIAKGAGERAAYDLAFNALKSGQYAESARLFQQFLDTWPGGAWAPNALYWLGESYYVIQDYDQAEQQFQALLDRYPTHDKAAGALLKVGLSQLGAGQLDAAERTLTDVTTRYPGSTAARTAADRLDTIALHRLR